MTHPTDPVAAMREACARRVEKAYIDRPAYNGSDSPEWVLANEMRRVAAAIRALPLPACATGDDAAHEGGLMARVENHLRGQVGLPPAPSRPADDGGASAAKRGPAPEGGEGDAVREAMRGIKALSLAHHAHEDPAVLLHALLVEIPAAIDNAAALLAAERAASDEKGG